MLRLAEDREKAQRDVLTYASWGERLSVEGYAAREQRLRAHRWAKEVMRTWLWVAPSGEVLASCETFRMESTHRGQAGSTEAVASVFTEERLRGQGHGTRMMKALVEQLARSDGSTQASVLYSEVGEALYGRAGYRAVPGEDWRWPSGGVFPAAVERLDETQLHRALFTRPAGEFQIWPTADQLDWHLERERIYAEQLGRTRPEVHGAQLEGARASWCASYRYEELVVLTLEAERAEEARALVDCARAVAAQVGLASVRWWSTPLPFSWEPGDVERRVREGSLAMLCPLRPELSPRQWRSVSRALWV